MSGWPGPNMGWTAYQKCWCTIRQAFPDLTFVEDERIIQDNRVAMVWTAHGTHLGRLMNIPPTRHQITAHGTSILRLENGKVCRARYIWDVAGILRSIGL